jgi:hypothetical protein
MFIKNKLLPSVIFTIGILISSFSYSSETSNTNTERGKYLIEIGGCNDCHTSGYAPSAGKIPEEQWLLGDNLGYRGPWGTTYPVNLREYMGKISEADWVAKAKTLETKPPMPWWVLNTMTEKDLSEIYKFIKRLGVVKKPVPSYVPPEMEPKTPYIQWPLPPK